MRCIECEKRITNRVYKLSADVYCSVKCLWKCAKRQIAHSIEICNNPAQAYEDEAVKDIQEALFKERNG